MSGRILLITDDSSFAALNAYSDLPPRWLLDADPQHAAAQAESPAPLVLRCRHDLFLSPPSGDQPSLDAATRAELINSFLDATICYVAVVGGAAMRRADEETGPLPCPVQLAEHAAWYQRFRAEVAARAKAREIHLRHVLVLVCREEINASDEAYFQQLVAGSGNDPLFNTAYVMLHELEPGRKSDAEGALLLNAEHVWPLAVGDLLLKLLHDEQAPHGGPTASYAWRSYPLLPEFPAAEQNEMFAEQFDRFYRQLTDAVTGGPAWSGAPLTSFQPRTANVHKSQLRAPPPGRDPLQPALLEYSPLERLGATRSPSRWEKPLAEAGDAVARELSRLAISGEPAANAEAAGIWQAVHGNPHSLYAALADHQPISGPDLGDQFGTIHEHWDAIRAAERDRQILVQEGDGCSEHFTQAQHGHVNWLYRLIVFGAVTLAAGYLAMAVFQPLVGAGHAFWIALSGAVGAMIAAMLSFDRERAAGRRAQEAFEEQLQRIDRAVIDRHEACLGAVEQADVFCQQTRATAAGRRLRQLLRRVQSMLDRELRPRRERRGQAADGGDRLLFVEDPSDKRLAAARRQRLRYAQATRLGQPVDLDDLQAVRRDEELAKFIDQQVMAFRDDVWLKFCQRYDRARAGHLPARQLVPLLRSFRDGFQKVLAAKIRELAIRRFPPEALTNWGKQLRDVLELQAYFELMSCRMLSHHTADQLSRPRPRLYVRKGFDPNPLMLALSGSQVLDQVKESSLLVDMPLLGLLFQEMPVQFQTNDGGKIVVASYRENDRTVPPLAARRGPAVVVSEDGSPATPPADPAPKRRRRPK